MSAPVTAGALRARLDALAEPDYARFASGLIPNCPPMLGVRLPRLRALARELARTPDAALEALDAMPELFEAQMLHGLVVCCAKLEPERRRPLLEAFLPCINNWSVCDSAAASCGFMAAQPAFWLPWLRGLAARREEFPARFGLVCLLDHFTDTPEHCVQTLDACAGAPCPAPYARLAVAWAVCEVCVKFPDQGLAFLRAHRTDPAAHNKAIAKICESRRASPALKAAVRALKR